jgi:hypothetical protein
MYVYQCASVAKIDVYILRHLRLFAAMDFYLCKPWLKKQKRKTVKKR